MLRRRNRLSSRQSQIVVGLAVLSGVLGALAGCHPTQTAGVDPVLTGLAAALVTWAGATSVWWVAGGAGAVDHGTVPDEQIVVHCGPVLAEEVFLIGGQAESVAFRGELKSLKLSHVFWRLTTVDS